MKTLSQTLSLGLLIGSFSLSSLTSSLHADPIPFTSVHGSTEDTSHQRILVATGPTADLIGGLRQGEQRIEAALIKGAEAEALAAELHTQNVALKWQTVASKAQVEELRKQVEAHEQEAAESTWQKVKNWFKSIDATKVATAVISGIVTIVIAIISIL